jgi:ATP-dependent protease Clp ATPase subunit
MKRSDSPDVFRCSFCNKHQDAVEKLISSSTVPRSYICDKCISICNTILSDEPKNPRSPGRSHNLANRLQQAIRHLFGHQRAQTAGQA